MSDVHVQNPSTSFRYEVDVMVVSYGHISVRHI